MYRMLLSSLLLQLCLPVAAKPVGDPVLEAVHHLDPTAIITSRVTGPLPDLVTAVVNGQPLYISTDGRYVFQGQLFDLERHENLSDRIRASSRLSAIKSIPPGDRISFAARKPLYRVTVFVDIECGYCHQLVANLDGYLHQGISIDFVAYPRDGLSSSAYKEAEAVWCSDDRHKALRTAYDAKPSGTTGCTNPVAREFNLAQALEIPGTPGIVAEDGSIVGGFLTPVELRQRLDQLNLKGITK